MNVAIVGSGYVGTTIAGGFASLGHAVTAIDIDEAIVEQLNAGVSPIHEPGLDALIAEHAGAGLRASTAFDGVSAADLVFIAVPTPTDENGNIDASAVRLAARSVAESVTDADASTEAPLIVVKSTVTPPEVSEVRRAVHDVSAGIEVATNPEFLREGSAVADFFHPDKLVFGIETERGERLLREVFAPIIEDTEPAVIATDPETAAMIKYANNAFLAAKISLINEIGNICKEFGIDAYEVADALGEDGRIGARFLRSGVGWGGSCFPKDVDALIAAARTVGYDASMLAAAVAVNDLQPERMLDLLERHLDPAGARVAVLGLSFKPGTDDIRNSRAIPLIAGLQRRQAEIIAYDPVAANSMRDLFPDIGYAESADEALSGADATLVVTDWPAFAELDAEFEAMNRQIIIDGRRIIDPPAGAVYEGLTW